jgi:diaminohydroxyphosphoribosylaminopyrimidine deaminase/5-amino-6-(5-phosphoribosylamino)uracil reductase
VRDAPLSGDQPTRVVVDTHARLPVDAAMLRQPGMTIVATAGAAPERVQALEAAGATVVDTGAGDAVDLAKLLTALGSRDITSVLVEGGSGLLGSLFDAGQVDKVIGIVAPVIIGGTEAPGPVGGRGAQTMPDTFKLTSVTHNEIGGDIVFIGYPHVMSPPRRTRRKRGN